VGGISPEVSLGLGPVRMFSHIGGGGKKGGWEGGVRIHGKGQCGKHPRARNCRCATVQISSEIMRTWRDRGSVSYSSFKESHKRRYIEKETLMKRGPVTPWTED